jgi:hypothetical protein
LCPACGNLELGTVQSPPGRTAEQREIAILACKDKARLAASTSERQAEGFLLGLTVVGVPFAYEIDKATQRSTFAECMHERGYNVIPPKE